MIFLSYLPRGTCYGCIIAYLKKEFGFAFNISRKGYLETKNPLFLEMQSLVESSIRSNLGYLRILRNNIVTLLRKIL